MKRILFFAVLFFTVTFVNAADFISAQTGNWNSPATWTITSGTDGDGIPDAGDNVIIQGGFTVTTNAISACNNLTIASSSSLVIAGFNFTVSGTTSISGTLTHSNAAGTKRFDGLVTINLGGTWTNTIDEAINFRGGLTNNGTFTSGIGIYTFTNNNQALNGNITIPSLDTSVTLTNNGILTVSTALSGTGTLTNAGTGTLNIGGTSGINTLTATAAGNTVNYNGSAQTVRATTYSNLTLSGSGAKAVTANITVNNNLTVSGTASLAPNAANRISDGSRLVLNGGSYTTGGFSESMNTLTLNENSTIALGTGNHTVNFAASNGTTWVAGRTLTITGWTGVFGSSGRIFVGTSTSGLTATQLAQVKFQVGADIRDATLLATGELVPSFCPFVSNTQSGSTQSICYNNDVAGTNIGRFTYTAVPVDRYIAVNVVSGIQYRIATTTTDRGFIKRLTLFNGSSTTTALATANATATNTAATIDWTATFTGVLYVVFNTANCQTSTQTDDITASYIGGGNNVDSQTAAGTNSWIGHVYNFLDSIPFGAAGTPGPSDSDAFSSYIGYFAQNNTVSGSTISFNNGYGGTETCFNVTAGGTTQTVYTETFSVRYRMQTTSAVYPAGCYFVNITGDDGVRLYIDGTLVFNSWIQQGSTDYNNVLVYLNGNSQLLFDFYEKNGGNVSNFSIFPAATTISGLNTVTPVGPITRCTNTPTLLTGGIVATQGNNTIAPVQYQWQSSTDNSTWTDISGATSQDFTVPGTSPTVATQIYYRRNVRGSTVNSSACVYSSNVVSIITGTTGTPAAPTYLPSTNISCSSFTANWNSVTEATLYRLDVSTVSDFSSLVPGYSNVNVGFVTSINVTGLGLGTYYYRVRAVGCGGATSANVNTPLGYQTVVTLNPSVIISGATTVCQNAASPNITFTNPRASAITVIYRINGGANQIINVGASSFATVAAPTITSGPFTYGLVSVAYQSAPTCSTIDTNTATIIVNPLPAAAGNIIGTGTVCQGQSGVSYFVPAITNATSYTWSYSGTGFTPSGTTSSITGSFSSSATSGNLTVTGVNACGNGTVSATYPIIVNLLPAAAGTITGTGIVCQGQSGVSYSVPAIANATSYTWSYTGTGFTPSGTTSSINGSFSSSATSGNLTVTGVNACGNGTVSATYPIIVNLLPAAAGTITGTGIVCQGQSGVSYSVPAIANATSYTWSYTGTGFTPSGTTSSITGSFSSSATSGNLTVRGVNSCGSGTVSATYPIVVNPLPSAPTVGTITNVTCSSTTGSVVLSGLQNGWIITQSGTALGSYTSSGTSYTVTGLVVGSYTFSVNNGTCTSASTPNVPIADASSTTWDGSSWSNGSPDATKNIIIASSLGSPLAANLTGCALTINNGVTATVPSGFTLTITNAVTTNGQLIFENNASLVQTTNATNIGAIEYRRISSPMKNFDYTYWSSPVSGPTVESPVLGQTAKLLSPNTLADKYFRFDGDVAVNDWVFDDGVMTPGVGFIIRVPKPGTTYPNGENWNTPTYSQPVAFKGTPNNGNYSFSAGLGEFNLIGNPYPSAIDADLFITNPNNATMINGALYFWTHNTAITNNQYTADDYASYTLTGGTGTGVGVGNFVDANNNGIMDPGEEVVSNRPLGKIAAGQSFFVENAAAGSFQFTNAMRVSGNNSQFFKQANTKKTATVEKNRVWLNLTNSGGAFKQLLVGYITGATNDWDNLYDGPSFDGQEFVDFYSTNQGKNLTIQGRALPFETTDVVPLGYRSTIAGPFDISIDNRDGALAGQEIWLEDKKTNTLHELTKGKYTFTAINGVENDRFVLKYTNKTLGTDDNEVVDKSLIVSVKNKKISLTSSAEAITQVQIFDLLGRKVYDKSKVNAQEWSISNLSSSEQTLIVKTTLANGAISNKKIIY
ncbi:T9SS sorting signal type C domain-containing protein [Flavobacterium polysaccharolyticum]|uniref:T9SS sorting signal type C domain-containing protein n=1 Tax=Flavobacterium polysaccharolyticum TaxID=3133148 RepID=A0ABU9NIT6_9FLAO